MSRCFLARFSDRPCEGQLERAHWIKQQVIKREAGGVAGVECEHCGSPPGRRCVHPRTGSQVKQHHWCRVNRWHGVVWDERAWTPACHGHHVAWDHARTLRVPREALPATLEEFAAELGLVWWLDRTYGPLEKAA